jgi:hypothetical protein
VRASASRQRPRSHPAPVFASRPYSSVEGAKRRTLREDAAARKRKAAEQRGEVELTELRGAAAARAAVSSALSKLPIDKLSELAPEQLAKRLRAEVEGLVGTEVRTGKRHGGARLLSALSAQPFLAGWLLSHTHIPLTPPARTRTSPP